jgi:hypothetical protein
MALTVRGSGGLGQALGGSDWLLLQRFMKRGSEKFGKEGAWEGEAVAETLLCPRSKPTTGCSLGSDSKSTAGAVPSAQTAYICSEWLMRSWRLK